MFTETPINPIVPTPFDWFWTIGSFVFGLIFFAAVVGLIVLLVRYLLVATKAAKLYVKAHEATAPAVSQPPAPVATEVKTRATKAPPTV